VLGKRDERVGKGTGMLKKKPPDKETRGTGGKKSDSKHILVAGVILRQGGDRVRRPEGGKTNFKVMD